MAGVCSGPGPCDTSSNDHGGKNWVSKAGGFPDWFHAIVNAMRRKGKTEGQAVAIAWGTVRRWARGGGNVTPETRAKAAAMVAQLDAMRGAAQLTAEPTPVVELAVPVAASADGPSMTVSAHMAALRKLASAHKRASPSQRPKIRKAMGAHAKAIQAGRCADMAAEPSPSIDLSTKPNPGAAAETELIRRNRETPAGRAPHKFQPAKWTHPNGHPRCKLCGTEERIDGMCDGSAKDGLKTSAPGSKGVATANLSNAIDLAWDEAKHPRVGGKFAPKGTQTQGTKPAGQPTTAQLSPEMAAQIRDFQKRMGLPVTGSIDGRTQAALKGAVAAKGGGGGKGGGKSKAGGAAAKAAKAVAAAQKKAAALATRKAKAATAAKTKAQRATAAIQAKAQRVAATKATATVGAVNKLTATQRALYRQRVPTPPAGYAWTSAGTLAPVRNVTAAAGVAAALKSRKVSA